MSLVVRVTSKKKGSNPGGLCTISDGRSSFEAYFKYVYGIKHSGSSSFRPSHQPIYEAVTFELAKSVGLDVPETYVLLNMRRDVRFDDWRRCDSCHDPSGRDFYFASKMLRPSPEKLTPDEVKSIIDFERVYLDALMISDIVGKSQNYLPYSGPDKKTIFYLDLGCSFVHAVDGFLRVPHMLGFSGDGDLKRMIKHLGTKSILTTSQSPINLARIVEEIPSLKLQTLNPYGKTSLSSVLSSDEVNEIQKYLTCSLYQNLGGFRERGLLV